MYQERIKRVLDSMEEMGLDQMLVSDPDSIWYLTGYDVFPCLLFISAGTGTTSCF